MNKTVFVRLDESEIGLAKKWSDELMATGMESRPNYTGISMPGRYVTGFLGELAFASWLDSMRIAYRHRVQLQDKSDEPEFVVWVHGRQTKLDVKAASGHTHTRMMMPAVQKMDAQLYLSARVADAASGLVELMGWMWHEKFAVAEVSDFGYGPTRFVDMVALDDMESLMRLLDPVRLVRRSEVAA